MVLEHFLDAVQLGVAVGVVGLLPRLGALERDIVGRQQLTHPLPADPHPPAGVVVQVRGQLADAPPLERQPQLLRTLPGRPDDQRLIVSRDPAGTATRPLGVQRRHPRLVEPMDHLAHPVLRRRHQPGDHPHRVPPSRRMNHHSTPPPHMGQLRLGAAPAAHDPLKLPALLRSQPPHPQTLCHAPDHTTHPHTNRGRDHPQRPWTQH